MSSKRHLQTGIIGIGTVSVALFGLAASGQKQAPIAPGAAGQKSAPAAATAAVSPMFETKVRPLLLASCVGCHGKESPGGGLRLDVAVAPEKIERVLFNLVTYAIRHTPSDGSVAVQARARGDEVVVQVADTGEGLGAEAAERMFERFWRGDEARTAGGAGLGLAIARGLVEAHGGRIWAQGNAGKGALFSFTLRAVDGAKLEAPFSLAS